MDPFLRAAFEEAMLGLAEGGLPIGSVLMRGDEIIGRGHNRRVQNRDPMAHAEIDCLTRAGRQGTYADTVLYSTLMPCFLCSGAVVQFGIPKVVVGESVNFPGGEGPGGSSPEFLRSHGVEVVDLADPECVALMAKFIRENPALWNEDIGRDASDRAPTARLPVPVLPLESSDAAPGQGAVQPLPRQAMPTAPFAIAVNAPHMPAWPAPSQDDPHAVPLSYAGPRPRTRLRLPARTTLNLEHPCPGVVQVVETMRGKLRSIVSVAIALLALIVLPIQLWRTFTWSPARWQFEEAILASIVPGAVWISGVIILPLVIRNTWRRTILEAGGDPKTLSLTLVTPFSKSVRSWPAQDVQELGVDRSIDPKFANPLVELVFRPKGGQLIRLFPDHPEPTLQSIVQELRAALGST